jgi:hypothetical protein
VRAQGRGPLSYPPLPLTLASDWYPTLDGTVPVHTNESSALHITFLGESEPYQDQHGHQLGPTFIEGYC